jgi:hypothetical protein
MSKDYAPRSGFKWTVNESLRLEREYDLLKMSIEDIALLHQRTPYAIMYKLDDEGIADFNDLYEGSINQESDADNEADEDEESDADDEESDADEECDEEEEEAEESEASEEYDRYNLKQQVGILTKQLRSLTSVVYKFMMKGSNQNEMAHC